MMSIAPPLLLSREQAMRLQTYIQTYRQYAFSSLLPSTERNNTLRILQVVQGKIIEAMDQSVTPLQLVLAKEEGATLKTVTTELLILYARQPDSNERTATLGDLAGLKTSLRFY